MSHPGTGDDEVHRITDAPPPHSDDLDQRMGRYLLSMLIRTVCFLLLFVVDGPLRWVCAAGAITLPYVAVVMANAGRAGTRRTGARPGPGGTTAPLAPAPVPASAPPPAADRPN